MRSRRIFLAILIGMIAAAAPAADPRRTLTTDVTTDPEKARFVYKDLENFIRARKAMELQTGYLDRATPGLRMFIEKYDLTLDRLKGSIQEHPEAYARLEETLAALRSHEPSFRKGYADLEAIVPDAVFPPTYFLVGAHRGIGSGSIEGPLITIEKETAESIREDLVATLVHEMVHMQQLASLGEAYFSIFQGKERTLLALCIREGIATWISRRITGGSVHKNLAYDYLIEHESDLWERFRKDMLGQETGDWLWKEPEDPEQPPDVGYAIGDRIVATYYEGAADKTAAMREILSITDYPALLTPSGYGEGFGGGSEGH